MTMEALRRAGAYLERRGTRPDGGPDRGFFLLVLLAAYALFLCTYLPINLFSVGREAHTLWLPEEKRIPLIPEFEYLYASAYLLPAVAILKIRDAGELVRLVAAFLITLFVAYATYLVFPVYLERPELTVDSLATYLLSLEYLDPSYNHFPSLHVAISVLLFLACRSGVRRPGLFLLVVAGISVSTLFVKQHYIVDVAYGAGLAAGAWKAAGVLLLKAPRRNARRRAPGRGATPRKWPVGDRRRPGEVARP